MLRWGFWCLGNGQIGRRQFSKQWRRQLTIFRSNSSTFIVNSSSFPVSDDISTYFLFTSLLPAASTVSLPWIKGAGKHKTTFEILLGGRRIDKNQKDFISSQGIGSDFLIGILRVWRTFPRYFEYSAGLGCTLLSAIQTSCYMNQKVMISTQGVDVHSILTFRCVRRFRSHCWGWSAHSRRSFSNSMSRAGSEEGVTGWTVAIRMVRNVKERNV